MYSAAVFLCVIYRVTSGFTVTASHNLRKSASRQLLEHKPFVVVDREKIPEWERGDHMAPLKKALEHEMLVTASINAIYAAAYEVRDFRTM